MTLVRRHDVCLHVARRADLEGDLTIHHKAQQIRIVNQRHAMSNAMGAAEEEGLADGFRSPRFTGVNGQIQQVISGVVEGVSVSAVSVVGAVSGSAVWISTLAKGSL